VVPLCVVLLMNKSAHFHSELWLASCVKIVKIYRECFDGWFSITERVSM